MEVYKKWLKSVEEQDLLYELNAVSGDEKAIEDRFYKELTFGTGGLRGVIGAGTNRMNAYTVGRATLGLAEYMLKTGAENRWSLHTTVVSNRESLPSALLTFYRVKVF